MTQTTGFGHAERIGCGDAARRTPEWQDDRIRHGSAQPFDGRAEFPAHGCLIQAFLIFSVVRNEANNSWRGIATEIPMPVRVAGKNMAFRSTSAPKSAPAGIKAFVATMCRFLRHKKRGAYIAALQYFGDLLRFTSPTSVNGQV